MLRSSHVNSDIKCLRYLYILEVWNRGNKSKFYGQRNILYIGITDDIRRRLNEHLLNINSVFLSKNFCDARKKLVFVKQVIGDEYDLLGEELKVKNMSKVRKLKLIDSDENDLILYSPMKVIVLRNIDRTGEIAIKMR